MIRAQLHSMAVPEQMKFVETKYPDMKLVARLLDACAAANQWTNFGPLYDRMADEYAAHMSLAPGLVLTPCANAGIALEMVARTLAAQESQPKLRWIGSVFSFKNLGRGYFSDMDFVDCDAGGVLDIDALKAVPVDSYDGIIVTNPFGMARDFDRFCRFAEANGKKLIIDNAAGMDSVVPDWPWQVFSLHHTKPYGVGEGGLVLSPDTAHEFLRLIINYDEMPADPAYWLNNGKISDIACAFHIARLRGIGDWDTAYLEQRERVTMLFEQAGARTLLPISGAPLTNSLPVLLGGVLDPQRLAQPRTICITRQYPPLAPAPQASAIFSQLINFPTHPELQQLSDAEISADIDALMACRSES